ncbi:hypothetical protein PPYR_14118 [Photinus pyralis]|uniref:Uncharacterized protein n=1 Tax=Photinus pyralis TaxID=7054 RepID=A0A1Y1KMJ0_PHOPY|nr:ankyrin repeat domain-containing protein 49-like [Photinus pyralis]KAB0792159.1 hypothetical protein PPYR_14118 [Photinus pyralis]
MESSERFLVSGWDDDLNDIDEEQHPHETPEKEILWASEKGKLDVVQRLLDSDRNLVHVTDSDGYTPLHRACYSDHVEIVSFLLANGASVSAVTQMKWQPLHSACQWNNVNCAVRLLQHGADINAVTEGGQTPLHIAASHGASYKTIELLLMHPYIKPEMKNNGNETAYDIAKRSSKYYHIFDMALPALGGIHV